MDNFEIIGKKMPYTVPEGFFEQSGLTILAAARAKRRKKILWGSGAVLTAIAASLVAAVVLLHPVKETIYDEYLASLSNEEISSWVAFYENDIFLDQNDNY